MTRAPLASPGPATHLQVIAPENVRAGRGFNVLVEAEDASNRRATGYTGTVRLGLGTKDAGATQPAAYTFTARDHGMHLFHITLTAPGAQTVKAADTKTASIAGSATTQVRAAPAATRLLVLTPETTTPGTPARVTVAALDASGHVVPNYTGTVRLTSSDGKATLPANYTFTAADHGRHTFQVTFQTPGSQQVTATDTKTGSVTGQGSVLVKAVGPATHVGVIALRAALAGFPTPVEVVALDASNQVVSGYTGTVHFASSDGKATLPANYHFVAADGGEHVFSVTFATAGKQTLTVTDTSSSTITGSINDKIFTLSALPPGTKGPV
jgi:hypothetical protein